MGPVTHHMPHGHWPVKQFDRVKDDVIAPKNSRIKLKSNDLLRIRSREYVKLKQEFKASHTVVAPLPNGRRRCASDVAERRRTVMIDTMMLWTLMEKTEVMRRTRSSPWSCRACRRGRRWSGRGDWWWPGFGCWARRGWLGASRLA
jgi:hypothetical protein